MASTTLFCALIVLVGIFVPPVLLALPFAFAYHRRTLRITSTRMTAFERLVMVAPRRGGLRF